MSSIQEVYRETVRAFAKAGILEAEAEAKVLMAHACGCDFSQLCLRLFDDCESKAEIRALTKERLEGKPLAYVLREKHFYGRTFYVDERVLIPRFDTECVAAQALALAARQGLGTALDLCCGSGILGITLAAEGTFRRVLFADISQGALDVTKINCSKHIPAQEHALLCGDFAQPVTEKVGLVVCNPPYIGEREYAGLEAQVREYEPRQALLAGNGGYAFYERAAREIPRVLQRGGALVLEIGDTQAARVRSLLNENGFDKIECGCDLAGRPRWVSATWPGDGKS